MGLSRAQLAGQVGVDREKVEDWERGERYITPAQAGALAAFLGFSSVPYLLGQVS